MIRQALIVSLLYFTHFTTYGQDLNILGRGNLSIGADYQTLDYNGGGILYSPGGGMGIELGLQWEIVKNLMIQPTLGYQLHLAIQAESINGVSNKSSFTFNRKFASFGIIKKFGLTDGTVNGLLISSGINLNIPGTLKRIENKNKLGESKYDSNIGFHFEVALRLKISENIFLDPAIRYRQLNFNARSFSEGTISDLPADLQKLNSNGIEFGLTIAKKLKSNKY